MKHSVATLYQKEGTKKVLASLISILAGTPVGSTIVAADILAFLACSALGRARGGETG